MSVKCSACGNMNPDNARFCMNCRAPVASPHAGATDHGPGIGNLDGSPLPVPMQTVLQRVTRAFGGALARCRLQGPTSAS